MKTRHTALALLSALLIAGTSACSKDDDPEIPAKDTVTPSIGSAIAWNADNLWSDWNKNVPLPIAIFSDNEHVATLSLSHSASDYGGFTYSTGFVASRQDDTSKHEDMTQHQYTVISGGGYSTSDMPGLSVKPFIVANWSAYDENPAEDGSVTRSCEIKMTVGDKATTFSPVEVYVNNTCYAYYAMLDGDNFTRPFKEGDWFKLIAHGISADGKESKAEFYLADCKGDKERWFVKDWTRFDLSKLGTVSSIYFTMESSDNSEYGMNTPAYFVIDNLTIEKP